MTYVNNIIQSDYVTFLLSVIPITSLFVQYINNHIRRKKSFFNAIGRIDFYYPPDIENIEICQYDIDMSIAALQNILIFHSIYPSTSHKVLEILELTSYYLSLLKDPRHNKESTLYCNIFDLTVLIQNFSFNNHYSLRKKTLVDISKLGLYEICFFVLSMLFLFIPFVTCILLMLL